MRQTDGHHRTDGVTLIAMEDASVPNVISVIVSNSTSTSCWHRRRTRVTLKLFLSLQRKYLAISQTPLLQFVVPVQLAVDLWKCCALIIQQQTKVIKQTSLLWDKVVPQVSTLIFEDIQFPYHTVASVGRIGSCIPTTSSICPQLFRQNPRLVTDTGRQLTPRQQQGRVDKMAINVKRHGNTKACTLPRKLQAYQGGPVTSH